ncbi:MAG: hypothetical protein WCS89_04005 [Candidatus Paceibacterota bacterium]
MNNNQKPSKMPYIIIAIIVIISVIGYFYWSGTQTPVGTTLEQTDDASQAVGSRVFKLLGEINSLKVDSTFFNEPAYRTLIDYSIEIPVLQVGRTNPFAPLSRVATSSLSR